MASFAALLTGALVLPIGLSQQSERWTHTALSTIFKAAWANEIPAPEQTIRNAILELQRAANDKRKRASAANTVHEILQPRTHTRIISRQVLGKHWIQASESQQQEFERLFMMYIAGFYAGEGLLDVFQTDSGLAITFGQTELDGNNAVVRMNIHEPNSTLGVGVGFVMYDYNGRWKVVDIRMESFSVISTKRAEFRPHIARHGIGPVIDYLRKEVQQYYN